MRHLARIPVLVQLARPPVIGGRPRGGADVILNVIRPGRWSPIGLWVVTQKDLREGINQRNRYPVAGVWVSQHAVGSGLEPPGRGIKKPDRDTLVYQALAEITLPFEGGRHAGELRVATL